MTPTKVTAEVCKHCEEGHVEVVQMSSVYSDGNVHVTYADEFSKCPHCGDEFYTFEQSMARSRAMTAAIRKSQGLPSGEEIRATRIRLGMSLPEFERAMGVGKKTIGRWERGTVAPTAAANIGLWLAKNYPETFKTYARERGVVVPAPRSVNASGQTLQAPSVAIPQLKLITGGQKTATGHTKAGAPQEQSILSDKESIEA